MPNNKDTSYFTYNTEDICYNDRYQIPLKRLVAIHKPATHKALSLLLDEYGYYGRYKIKYTGTPSKHQQSGVVIDVLLPWAGITYRWPTKGYYSLSKREFSQDNDHKKLGIDTQQLDEIFVAVNNVGYEMVQYLPKSLDKVQSNLCLSYLKSLNLSKPLGSCVIREMFEIKEFKENVLGVIH